MSTTQARWISFTGRMLAVLALTAAGGAMLHAQTESAVSPAVTAAAQSAADQAPKLDLQSMASGQEEAFSSSSASSDLSGADGVSANTLLASNISRFNFVDAMQYGGGRQRYGRPRYRGGNTNPDGSPKWDFYVGGGFTAPVGDQSNYLTPSWGLHFGGGRMWNKHFGVNLEFAYDNFGMTGDTINNQSELYFGSGNTSAVTGLDANSHVWSFGIQPIYNIRSGEGIGAYITGGVGFYHKVANFTLPQQEEYCDPYYGCGIFEAPVNIDHYTSNAPGFDGGFGLTYKFSRFASERLYAEVRYVFVANEYRPGITPENESTYTGYNFFPQNSQHTSYFPVKFGIRF